MSAFGSKADMKWCRDESPLMTQSGRFQQIDGLIADHPPKRTSLAITCLSAATSSGPPLHVGPGIGRPMEFGHDTHRRISCGPRSKAYCKKSSCGSCDCNWLPRKSPAGGKRCQCSGAKKRSVDGGL